LKRIGATSLLNVTGAFDFPGPSALLEGDTKKAAARMVSAVRAVESSLFMIVTSFYGCR
jgi:hypothetical protein